MFELEVDIKFELFVFVSEKKNFDNFFISILNTFKKFLCFFVWVMFFFFFVHLLFVWEREKRREEKRRDREDLFSGVPKKRQKRRESKKDEWEFRVGDFFSFFWVKGMKKIDFFLWMKLIISTEFLISKQVSNIYFMKLIEWCFLGDWEENEESKEDQKKIEKNGSFLLCLLCFVVNFSILYSLSPQQTTNNNKQTTTILFLFPQIIAKTLIFFFLLIELVLSFFPTTTKTRRRKKNMRIHSFPHSIIIQLQLKNKIKKKKRRERNKKNKTFNWMINSTMFWSFATSSTVFPS